MSQHIQGHQRASPRPFTSALPRQALKRETRVRVHSRFRAAPARNDLVVRFSSRDRMIPALRDGQKNEIPFGAVQVDKGLAG
jgi:hypothetical protein